MTPGMEFLKLMQFILKHKNNVHGMEFFLKNQRINLKPFNLIFYLSLRFKLNGMGVTPTLHN
jgi:hypothetical protein